MEMTRFFSQRECGFHHAGGHKNAAIGTNVLLKHEHFWINGNERYAYIMRKRWRFVQENVRKNRKGRKRKKKRWKRCWQWGGGCGILFKRSGNGPMREGSGAGRKNLENDTERLEETTVNSEMSFYLRLWYPEAAKARPERKTQWQVKGLNTRVWSWLRTNAGGVLNTCKSNEDQLEACFWLIRVADGWVTREQSVSYRGITHRKMC